MLPPMKWFRLRMSGLWKKTGKNARQIFDLIKYLVREAGVKAKEEDWNSYDVMNKKIEDYLDGRVRVG